MEKELKYLYDQEAINDVIELDEYYVTEKHKNKSTYLYDWNYTPVIFKNQGDLTTNMNTYRHSGKIPGKLKISVYHYQMFPIELRTFICRQTVLEDWKNKKKFNIPMEKTAIIT